VLLLFLKCNAKPARLAASRRVRTAVKNHAGNAICRLLLCKHSGNFPIEDSPNERGLS
jgi:hypothetical protein